MNAMQQTTHHRSGIALACRRMIAAAVVVSTIALAVGIADAHAREERSAPTGTVAEDPPREGTEGTEDEPETAAVLLAGAESENQSGDLSSGPPVAVAPIATDIDGFGATNTPTQTNFHGGDGFDSGEDGCDIDCITSALTYPTADPTVSVAEIETTVLALVDLWLPIGVLGDPADLLAADIVASSDDYGTSVELEVTGLEPGTTRTLVVRATDLNGDEWWDVGSFDVPEVPDLLITINSIEILNDGDTNAGNPGELWFTWGFGSQPTGGSSEVQHHTGEILPGPADGNTLFITEAWGPLPGARVNAYEDDPDDGQCPANALGELFNPELSGSIDCWNTQWTGTQAGIHTLNTIDSFPLCTAQQVAQPAPNLHCEEIETMDFGSEYPRIRVVVSYEITP